MKPRSRNSILGMWVLFVLFNTSQAQQIQESKWRLQKTESFGVVSDPDSIQMNDFVSFGKQNTFSMCVDGKKVEGSFTQHDKMKHLLFLKDGKQTIHLKILNMNDSTALFEVQTPDLVKTKWHVKKQ